MNIIRRCRVSPTHRFAFRRYNKAMTSIILGLVLTLLPVASARAASPLPTHGAIVTFRLTLSGPVTATDTFAVFAGAHQNPSELLLCGTQRGEGIATLCAKGTTLSRSLSVPANVPTPFSVVYFSGRFGPTQRSHTILLGRTTFTHDTTVDVAFPRATVPVTFRLHLYGTPPAREYVAVNPPRGNLTPNDLQFCTSDTLPSHSRYPAPPQGYARSCVGQGALYVTTIQAPLGQTVSFAFYRQRLTTHYLVESDEVFDPGTVRVTKAITIDASYTFGH